MKVKTNTDESENLRESLLDLERVHAREREMRLETEALLEGLQILNNYENRQSMFTNLLGVMKKLIGFEDAFILSIENSSLKTMASTSPQFQDGQWLVTETMTRMSLGRPVAIFDIGLAPSWRGQPEDFREGVVSALHILLRDQPKPALLICTHSQRGFFSQSHLRLASRFALLASQALTNLDYMAELEKVNSRLQTEIQEKKKAQVQAIHSSKMAALGEMAGGIAHEINTPLAVISMRVEQMEECVCEGDVNELEFMDAIEVVKKTTDRIAKIIGGLRFFAREGKKDVFQIVAVSKLIEETLSFCSERFSNHGVQLNILNNIGAKVECRSVEISQVLLNLLNNAYDAIEQLDEKWISIEVAEHEQHIEISVTDSGNGISQDIQDKIMQPFFTTKPIGKGTGLGLSVSVGIATAHQGKLYIDKESPHTRFVLSMPKTQALIKVLNEAS